MTTTKTDSWFSGRFDELIAALQERAEFPINSEAQRWLLTEAAMSLSVFRLRLFGRTPDRDPPAEETPV